MSKECHHCLLKLYCGRRISFGQCTSSHSLKEEVVEVMPAMGPPGHCYSFFFVVVVFVVCLYIVFLIGMNWMFWEFVSNQEKSKEYTMER